MVDKFGHKLKDGVFADSQLKRAIHQGLIKDALLSNVEPGSLDLRTSDTIFEVSSLLIPYKTKDILLAYKKYKLIKRRLNIKSVLKRGHMYLVRLKESLNLSNKIRALISPKSSIGRIDLHVRVINPITGRLDSIPYGYKGELWCIIIPKSFNIKLDEDIPLTQLRLIKGIARIKDYHELKEFIDKYKVVHSNTHRKILLSKDLKFTDYDNYLLLTVDLEKEIIAWERVLTDKVLDLSAPPHSYGYKNFFKPIYRQSIEKSTNSLKLRANSFYIMTTAQRLVVPANWSAEFITVDTYTGEFRGHYAGFVDPGWGMLQNGRQLTLEVRPFEDISIIHDQPIIKIAWDKLLDEATTPYDLKTGSHYTQQKGPTLAKWFKV